MSGVGKISDNGEKVDARVFHEAVQYLRGRIDDQGTWVRKEMQATKDELRAEIKQQGDMLKADMKQQGDRLNRNIDHVLKDVLPMQIRTVHTRMDDMESTMKEKFKAVEHEMKSMRDDIHFIMRMLHQMSQGAPVEVPPLIVEHPPSSHSHDAAEDDSRSPSSLGHSSDPSQRSAPGPSSSPRHRQETSAIGGEDHVSLSPSTQETKERFLRIRRIASQALMSLKPSKEKGKGPEQ